LFGFRTAYGFAWKGVIDALGLDPPYCLQDDEISNHQPMHPATLLALPVDLSGKGPMM
jgi:hypothetical protein